jgi:hypothetical protein
MTPGQSLPWEKSSQALKKGSWKFISFDFVSIGLDPITAERWRQPNA